MKEPTRAERNAARRRNPTAKKGFPTPKRPRRQGRMLGPRFDPSRQFEEPNARQRRLRHVKSQKSEGAELAEGYRVSSEEAQVGRSGRPGAQSVEAGNIRARDRASGAGKASSSPKAPAPGEWP